PRRPPPCRGALRAGERTRPGGLPTAPAAGFFWWTRRRRANLRPMVLLVIGAGLAAVTGLSGVFYAGRKGRKRRLESAADAAMHPHYCAECDQEWPHTGQTCLYPWASRCAKCAGAPVQVEVAALGSRA